MSKKVLITGGAGFIGSNLALKLISKNYTVTVLDNLSPQIHGDPKDSPLYNSIKDKVNFIEGDVRCEKDWEKALVNIDIVVHLAAETGTGQSMYCIQKYIDVNINGTGILLDYLVNHKHHISKVVIASSRAIYGEGKYYCKKHGNVYPEDRLEINLSLAKFDPVCPICSGNVELKSTDENSKIHPSSIYGITKQNQEQMILNVCQSLKIPAVAFRYQNVYGPGQSLKNPYTGILSIFSTQIKNNNAINIFEDGKESRDFVYIDDVVNATILGIESDDANFEVFNVGSGTPTSVSSIAKMLKENYKSNIDIEISGNYRVGDIRHNYADLSKIKSKLGFTPSISIDLGITYFTRWVDNQEISFDNYNKSIAELKEKGLFK